MEKVLSHQCSCHSPIYGGHHDAGYRVNFAEAQRELTDSIREVYTSAPSSLLLTVEEAAGLLHIGRTTMFAIIQRGEISTVTIGRRRFVVREELMTFVNGLSR